MRVTFWTVSLFHLIGFVYSSIQQANISIIGGSSVASSGQFPFMASLPLPLGSCGGTLIDPSYILTAAHCVSFYTQADAVDFPVYLNTLDVMGSDFESITASVSSFVVHEGYSSVGTGYVNDVALLVLSQPVTTVNPVPLPKELATTTVAKTTTKTTTKPTTKTTTKPTTKTTTKPTTKTTTKPTTKTTTKPTTKTTTKPTTKTTTKPKTTTKATTKPTTKTTLKTTTKPKTTTKATTKPTTKTTTKKPTTKKPALRAFSTYANMDAVINGWGVQADGYNSDVLTTAAVTIFDNSVCTTKWGTTQFNGNSMMCASKNGQSACMDDDGGPILVGGVQVGIASFFPEKCGDANFPAVFTRVSSYLNWINNAMATNPPPAL